MHMYTNNDIEQFPRTKYLCRQMVGKPSKRIRSLRSDNAKLMTTKFMFPKCLLWKRYILLFKIDDIIYLNTHV